MNPFRTRITGNSWVASVGAMSVVLGFMMSLAWLTDENRGSRSRFFSAGQNSRIFNSESELQKQIEQIRGEVSRLREENTKLQNAMSNETSQAKLLNDSLQDLKMFAGLTELEGPGVTVTLRDRANTGRTDELSPDSAIHDTDVLKVVNELWNAGAEAIAVNGNRVVTGTSFRCVGSVILVDSVKIASPVVIQAIGDTDALYGGMNLPLGVLDEIRSTGDPSMVQIEKVKKMMIPAFTGVTARKFGKVPAKQ